MKLSEIQLGIQHFAEAEMIPHASGGLHQVLLYAGLTIFNKQIQQMEARFAPMAKSIGILDENGDYNMELLHEAIATGVEKVGAVNVLDMIFRKADIDTLFDKYLKG